MGPMLAELKAGNKVQLHDGTEVNKNVPKIFVFSVPS